MTELNKLDATTAASGLAAGDFTAEQLMQDCLARVGLRDADVRAWAHIDSDYALQMARAADLLAPHQRGPLHGLPVGIKDIIDTADMPTEHGSPAFAGRRPTIDAQCVTLLRAAGAIIMGKTVTTELANTNPSKTRNPHNLEHTPGGSSSGSGAGVADFQVPLALGTQTGGSVIRPASFNGIYGLKPTLGLMPRAGVLLQSHTLDTVGVYGRSLQDLALITDCISSPDSSDPQSYLGMRTSLRDAYKKPLAIAPRLAFLKTLAWEETHQGAKAAIEDLADSLGEHCESATLASPYERILELHAAVFGAENAHYYGGHFISRPDTMSDKLRTRMAASFDLPARHYIDALNQREVIYGALESLLAGYDAILCLSATGPAPRGFDTTGSPAYNSPWTYLGVPCISLPRLTVESLPLGVQLVGTRGAEAQLMRVARWLDCRLAGA
jgi:Asp-tRNA(Asn)/Glu-tRNA(Gln) amidotransferase A subunit family amidase